MKHLAQIHIGPVQGFIATARRTRDLWFGSRILSEVSKAVALNLAEQGAALIFPSASKQALAPDGDLPVANIILAEIEAPDEAQAYAQACKARDAALKRWAALCAYTEKEVRTQRPGKAPPPLLRRDIWKAQCDDVIESFVVVLKQDGAAYAGQVDRLRGLVAARKNIRDFAPIAGEPAGLLKSSLDGMRSTVMREDDDDSRLGWREWRRRLGIEPTEQLDAAGLVKRVAGSTKKFVPVGRMALAPWLDALAAHEAADAQASRAGQPSSLAKLGQACEALVKSDLAVGLDTDTYPWAKHFAWDGQLLYETRRTVERRRAAAEDDQTAVQGIDALAHAAKAARGRWGLPEPSPYYALLLADGDRMGELIDAASSADEHRQVTEALAAFAASVPDIVNKREHAGACIYSGGDDVLALLRVDRAVGCAKALSEAFHAAMAGVAAALKRTTPTLSVGIAVCHMLDPLGDTREIAKQAETLAKQGPRGTAKDRQRNALGIIVKPRGGAAYSMRLRWDDAQALGRVTQHQQDFAAGKLPMGLPYELREAWDWAHTIFDPSQAAKINGNGPAESALFAELWEGKVRVLLSKKRRPADDEALDPDLVKRLRGELAVANAENALSELLVARWLCGHGVEAA